MMFPLQAHELNVLVAGAFRTAYAHSQSPSMSVRHAAIDTQRPSDEVSHADITVRGLMMMMMMIIIIIIIIKWTFI